MKKQYTLSYIENIDIKRITSVFYLNAEGLLGQPAASDPPVVLWREGVSDAQLLAHFLEGIVANHAKVFQKLFPSVNGHEHPPLVSFVLE